MVHFMTVFMVTIWCQIVLYILIFILKFQNSKSGCGQVFGSLALWPTPVLWTSYISWIKQDIRNTDRTFKKITKLDSKLRTSVHKNHLEEHEITFKHENTSHWVRENIWKTYNSQRTCILNIKTTNQQGKRHTTQWKKIGEGLEQIT